MSYQSGFLVELRKRRAGANIAVLPRSTVILNSLEKRQEGVSDVPTWLSQSTTPLSAPSTLHPRKDHNFGNLLHEVPTAGGRNPGRCTAEDASLFGVRSDVDPRVYVKVQET